MLFDFILLTHYLFLFKQKRKDVAGLFNKPFPHYYMLGKIYDRDRAIGANADKKDDDEEEICQGNHTSVNSSANNVNLGGELNNEQITKDSFDNMSYTPQINDVH